MEGLTEGRIVHFVVADGSNQGAHRPAIIARVWWENNADGTRRAPEDGYSNLVVFMDGTNDGYQFSGCVSWQTSVTFDPNGGLRTWHWIEKA